MFNGLIDALMPEVGFSQMKVCDDQLLLTSPIVHDEESGEDHFLNPESPNLRPVYPWRHHGIRLTFRRFILLVPPGRG